MLFFVAALHDRMLGLYICLDYIREDDAVHLRFDVFPLVLLHASDIDLVYANGYGFPKWRGGPMFWAQQVGLEKVLESIRGFSSEHDFWEPAPLLERLVAEKSDFSAYDASMNES